MQPFHIPFHPTKYAYHAWRTRLVQPLFWALFFLSPVFGVYQLDVIHNHLVFMGRHYPFETSTMMWLPIGFGACVLTIGLVSVLYGRLFCGWICPHNAMTEWLWPLRMLIGIGQKPFSLTQLTKRWPWMTVVFVLVSLVWAFMVTWAICMLFTSYFVPLDWQLERLGTDEFPMILGWGQALLMLIGLFLVYSGHEFCRNACPYGLLQSLSAYLTEKWTPMEIRYRFGDDQSACKSCRACETACPVDIDPRKPENLKVGIGEGCFNCGQCIDACHVVHEPSPEYRGQSFLFFQSPRKTIVEERHVSE